VKEAVGVPVIASLNGYTPGGWLGYARAMEQAGADALELNLYQVPTDPLQGAGAIEERAVEMVREVRRTIAVPLAVKLSPFYTAMVNLAARLAGAGADGLVLFNRFFEPDLDLEALEVRPRLRLSDSRELLLRLRWLAILSPALGSTALAVSGGVHTVEDAVKAVMCGASAIQLVSALLKEGPGRLATLREEMSAWMEEREYGSLREMRGSMNLSRCPDPTALSRANYMRMLLTWSPE
jgi:dihydroorotate dehydrogenase (fumarate)